MSDAAHWLFALCLWGTWYNHLLTILTADRMGYDRRLSLQRADLKHPAKRLGMLMTLPYLALVVAFSLGLQPLLSGLGSMALLLWLRRLCFASWPPGQVAEFGKYVPTAAAMLGYLCAHGVAVALGLESPERLGWEAACGVFGAAYLLSAIAKLRKSGWAWASSGVMGLLMAERAYGAGPSLRRLRVAVVRRPWLSAGIGRATLLVEAGAILFAYAPMRGPLLVALTALQLGIALLLGYVELEWMLLAFALTFVTAG